MFSEKLTRCGLGYKVVKNYASENRTYPPDKILVPTRGILQLCIWKDN